MNLPQRRGKKWQMFAHFVEGRRRGAVFDLIDFNEILFAAYHAFLMQY
jgi:hypothetical protein